MSYLYHTVNTPAHLTIQSTKGSAKHIPKREKDTGSDASTNNHVILTPSPSNIVNQTVQARNLISHNKDFSSDSTQSHTLVL
eukprot:CAMPEP_0197742450 /NCGR_PEP_ID=MMETSP1435-20131217/31369_1 /TAXON_ID=426625 /ORGANISM="Chaetoceros brevis, Strain CCMP164" /LENGTH=81 /DNA_ID=CAMNT_0043332973 /DNA_START=41 /DNA_END=286 /DNA_ORIENTATION=-